MGVRIGVRNSLGGWSVRVPLIVGVRRLLAGGSTSISSVSMSTNPALDRQLLFENLDVSHVGLAAELTGIPQDVLSRPWTRLIRHRRPTFEYELADRPPYLKAFFLPRGRKGLLRHGAYSTASGPITCHSATLAETVRLPRCYT